MRAHPISRRSFMQLGSLVASAGSVLPAAGDETSVQPTCHPLLTADKDFEDVSRGDPKPHALMGAAQGDARLTAETWRLEITADPFTEAPHTKVPASLEKPLTLADDNALDLPRLIELGKKHEVHFLKAMQCLNIATPLGQGLWSGVPLREVLQLCGRMTNVRRIYFRGFHNHDPKQIFQSSVSYTQCMESAPDELPVFLAYRLNGAPLSLMRGGPVRMIVPWSHGYKSIKWLQHIFVTNDARNNDTYAEGNNDPDSFLKTAAYVDIGPDQITAGEPVFLTGQVISGLSGVKRVEYWLRQIHGADQQPKLEDDAPELLEGPWKPCELASPPAWNSILPSGIKPQEVFGFNKVTGEPNVWPPRYGMCSFTATLRNLKPGHYELRARSVDQNGFAQPEPRPSQKSGKNSIQVRRFEVL